MFEVSFLLLCYVTILKCENCCISDLLDYDECVECHEIKRKKKCNHLHPMTKYVWETGDFDPEAHTKFQTNVLCLDGGGVR